MHGYCGSYRWAAGRHRRGRFGGFGFGGRHGGIGGGMNPDDMRAGRMLAQGDLRLVALALIAQAPRHGYEIIKLVEEKTADWYSPSPGIVYPTLTFLEEAGYVTVSAEGAKKLYTITAEGRAYLDANRDLADVVLDRLSAIAGGARRAGNASSGEACHRFSKLRSIICAKPWASDSKAMPKRKRIWSKSLPALPVKCSGAIDL
jgi:DNA-binding PadR family transcriptional regulator